MPTLIRSCPRSPTQPPAAEDERPFAVVGVRVRSTQLGELLHALVEQREVVAQLRGDAPYAWATTSEYGWLARA